jgi:hypothetical protein
MMKKYNFFLFKKQFLTLGNLESLDIIAPTHEETALVKNENE